MDTKKPRKLKCTNWNGRDYSPSSQKDITCRTILSLIEQEDNILNFDIIKELLDDFNKTAKVKISKLNSLSDFKKLTNKIELLNFLYETHIPYLSINKEKYPNCNIDDF